MFDAELSVPEKVGKIIAGSAYNDARDLRLKDGGGAHQARLIRAVDDAIAEIRSAKDLAGIVEGMELGMSEHGFFGRFPAPISRDHLVLASYDRADGQFAGLLGFACLLNGKLHILLVNVHAASLPSKPCWLGPY